MTHYHEQIYRLNRDLYGQKYLTRQVTDAKKFMDQHYAEAIDLDIISKAAHCSKFHFIRLFTRFYGQTPNQYLRGLRIDRAKEILARGLPVPETCYDSGFTSINSFRSLFKKYTGLSPLVWKKSNFGVRNQAGLTDF